MHVRSSHTCTLDRVIEGLGNHVIYIFQDGPDRAFVLEDLIHTPEDTQVPPKKVSGWK